MRFRNLILSAVFGVGALFAMDQKASACWCFGCYTPYYTTCYSYAPTCYYYYPATYTHAVTYTQPAASAQATASTQRRPLHHE